MPNPPLLWDPRWRGTPPPYAIEAAEVAAGLGSDLDAGLSASEAVVPAVSIRPQPDHRGEAAVVGRVALTQLRDPMNIMLVAVTVVSFAIGQVSDRGHRGAADPAQRGARAPGRSSRPGRASTRCPTCRFRRPGCCADGGARAGAGGRGRARRHGPGRSRRHRAGRRADRPVGDARDPGSGADRRERAGRARTAAIARRRRRSRSATARTCCSRTPRSPAAPRSMVVTGDRHGHPDGSDRHHADLGHADPVAAAEGARHADQGARHHRLDRGGVHRRRRTGPRHAGRASSCCSGTAMAISAIPTGLPAFVSGDALLRAPSSSPRRRRS